MKKLLLTISLLTIAVASFSQDTANDMNVTPGLSGGGELAFLKVKPQTGSTLTSSAEVLFAIGLNADVNVNKYFSIRPGIAYAGMGGVIHEDYFTNAGIATFNNDVKLHYLEIPLDFIGHLPVDKKGANFFLGAGPYYDELGYNNVVTKQRATFGSDGDFKSTDYGATTVLGFQTAGGFAISANADFGFANILKNQTFLSDAASAKTMGFYISVGESFK
jgi:hypothetical protein